MEFEKDKWPRSVVLEDIVAYIYLLLYGSPGKATKNNSLVPADLFLDLSVGPTHNIQNIFDWFLMQLVVSVITNVGARSPGGSAEFLL